MFGIYIESASFFFIALPCCLQVEGDLQAGHVNSVPSSVFVTKPLRNSTKPPDPLIFSGRKTFTNGLATNKTFRLIYFLNGYNLTQLMAQAMRLDDDQFIPGAVTIENDVGVVE